MAEAGFPAFTCKKVLGRGKKPIEFIEKFIKIATAKENLVILDFFGGSGSTAHATLDMNSTANNQFIVVQIPEKTFEIKNNSKKALKGCENVFNAGFAKTARYSNADKVVTRA